MAIVYFINYFIALNFCYSSVNGNTIVYTIDETDIQSTYIGTIANSSNLLNLAGQDDFENLKYSFLGTNTQVLNLFRIDEKTSVLETAGTLDRESVCEFSKICTLNIEVAAQSTRTSFFIKIPVTIQVNDLNDNAPVFDKPNITVQLSEAIPVETKVKIVGARDKDTSDAYSLHSYELQPADTPFSIEFEKKLDGTSTVILKVDKALDRETKGSYVLDIIAKDGGTPPQSGTLRADVIVTDVNDNSPIFSKMQYDITVKEDINISSVIAVVKAEDLDEGKNGEVTYRLSSHQSDNVLNSFAVNENTGELSVTKRLIYAPGKQYQIIVEASDGADQPLTSQTRIVVVVEDVGNSAPVIIINLLSGTNVAHITEYANKGTAVAHIAVHDDDTGDNGNVYCTMKSDFFELMLLGSKEYNVVVKSDLDREINDKHHVSVSCQDNGTPPFNVSSNFTIEIDDENDNVPMFSNTQYTETIFEGNKRGDFIVQVFAIDIDSGKNSEVKYFMASSGNPLLMIDNSTGIVRATMELDRELTPRISTEVFAVDQGVSAKTGTATIIVSVLDKNDNAPVFDMNIFPMEIFENRPSGIEIGQLKANDSDDGDNSKVVFALPAGTPKDLPFLLLPTGHIKTSKNLDRESQPSYGFYVIAYDLGYPPKTSTASVVVKVLDMNDHWPEIRGPNYANNTIVVSQSSRAGRIITIVEAYDKDEGVNSDLKFSILNKDTVKFFSINEDSGAIFLEKDISANAGTSYSLEIEVSDKGSTPKKSYLTLIVVITTEESDPSSHNIIIVTVLVSLTIIASAVIIAVIIFLRRVDRNGKAKKSTDKSDYYSSGTVIDPSVTVFSLPDDSILCSDKKKKKEVSFSIDDDQDHVESLQLPSKTSHPFDKMFVDKIQRHGDDSHSIGSASDSGRGNSDDELNRSPHPSGSQQKFRQNHLQTESTDLAFSPRKHSQQPLLFSPTKMNEQHGKRPLKYHTENPRNIFHFDQQDNGPVIDCVV